MNDMNDLNDTNGRDAAELNPERFRTREDWQVVKDRLSVLRAGADQRGVPVDDVDAWMDAVVDLVNAGPQALVMYCQVCTGAAAAVGKTSLAARVWDMLAPVARDAGMTLYSQDGPEPEGGTP